MEWAGWIRSNRRREEKWATARFRPSQEGEDRKKRTKKKNKRKRKKKMGRPRNCAVPAQSERRRE
jgi:hypothetical protein